MMLQCLSCFIFLLRDKFFAQLMPPKHHSSYDDDEKRFIIALCTRLGLKLLKVLSDNALPFRSWSALSGIVRWGHGAWRNTDYGKALWEHYAAMSNGDWVRAVEDLRRKVMLRHVGFDNPTLATKFHIYFIACANPQLQCVWPMQCIQTIRNLPPRHPPMA